MKKIEKRKRRVKKTTWQIQEAKARFSELVKEVELDGCHTITRNGKPVAVILSTEEFERMTQKKNSLVEFFAESPLPEIELDLERSQDLGRDIEL
jgi:prevent-host-death family protein